LYKQFIVDKTLQHPRLVIIRSVIRPKPCERAIIIVTTDDLVIDPREGVGWQFIAGLRLPQDAESRRQQAGERATFLELF
jgi:hypothetical protein